MKLDVPYRTTVMLASKLFSPAVHRPFKTTPHQDHASVSHRLLLDHAFIERSRGSPAGFFHILPLGQIVLDKLIHLIDRRMKQIGAQRLTLSTLCSSHLLDASGRMAIMKDYLYALKDSNLFLAPTHEESITSLFTKEHMLGCKDLPVLLYQITSKFRAETMPRFGLLRSNEFLMKDLYSFHASEQCAQRTYDAVLGAYERLFSEDLSLKTTRVRATSGAMGGHSSHEYHLDAEACGQDEVLRCEKCGDALNAELLTDETQSAQCCGVAMKRRKTLEIAHTFLLGTKYSKALKALFLEGEASKKPTPFYMACYGIGVTRLMAACAESYVVQSGQSAELRWPLKIAPFTVCVVPPKKGSKEEEAVGELAWHVAQGLTEIDHGGLLYDDRTSTTVGRRLNDAKAIGCSYVVVVNKTAATDHVPRFEFHDVINDTRCDLDHCQLFSAVRDICSRFGDD